MEVLERANSMKHTEYSTDGKTWYGSKNDAIRLYEWREQYKKRIKMEQFSRDKLEKHFVENGYEVTKNAVNWAIKSPKIYAVIEPLPKANAHKAEYEILSFFGVYDEFILDNGVFVD